MGPLSARGVSGEVRGLAGEAVRAALHEPAQADEVVERYIELCESALTQNRFCNASAAPAPLSPD